MIEQKQSELLPLTLRERIEAAARRFQEREDEKALRKAEKKAQALADGGGRAHGQSPGSCHNKEVTR